MSTFNVSGSTTLALSYKPFSLASNVVFNNVGINMFRLHVSTSTPNPFTSTDYGGGAVSRLTFANYGTVARARSSVNTFALKNESFLTFLYDYQNLTRQRPKALTGSSAVTFSLSSITGRRRVQVKAIGFTFGQSNSLVRGHTFSGPSAFTFGGSNSVIRNRYVPLSGVTAFLAANTGGRIFNPGLSGNSAFFFGQVGALGAVKNLSAIASFIFTQGGYSV